jgi:hypothetical protein
MKRAPKQPVGELLIYAGIFCKLWHVADAGTLLPQHAHEHDHISLIATGSVRVWQDDALLGDFYAPTAVKIPARALHKFLTLTDDVCIICIHNADHADPDGEPPVAVRASLELED